MRPDQDRVSGLIVSTVIKLCEKGLDFSNSVKIQGVIGVTIDEKDTFVIHVNKTVSINDCANNYYPLPTNKISSSNITQEPSSTGHRDGAVSVGSAESSTNVTDNSQYNSLLSNIKVENSQSVEQASTQSLNQGFAQETAKSWSSFSNINQDKKDLSSASPCEIGTNDASYDHSMGFVCNDEDTMEFQDSSYKIKSEDVHDIKPCNFQGNNVSGVIDIASDGEDGTYERKQMTTFTGQLPRGCVTQKPLNLSQLKHSQMSTPMKQGNLLSQMKMRIDPNNGGRFQVPRGEERVMIPHASASNRALMPVQQPRPRATISQQQGIQARPRIFQQGQSVRAPRGKVPSQQKFVNPSKMTSSCSVRAPSRGSVGIGRGSSSSSWKGENVAEQVVECQSGDGFSFNKQLTVLSRYCCNLCGKVYKNQRSVLHHQSQVHGRPKVKRRKKTDAFVEEGPVEEDYCEDDCSEEMW